VEGVKAAATLTLCLSLASGTLVAAHGQNVLSSKESAPSQLVEIKHLRGVVVDSKWAVIPKVWVTLRKQNDKDFRDIKSVETDEAGRFEFVEMTNGTYVLVFAAPVGFCHVSIPRQIVGKGLGGSEIDCTCIGN
jgi:hypothetical protein